MLATIELTPERLLVIIVVLVLVPIGLGIFKMFTK